MILISFRKLTNNNKKNLILIYQPTKLLHIKKMKIKIFLITLLKNPP